MALTTGRIVGKQLTVTIDGEKTLWNEVSLRFIEEEENAGASDSTEIESVQTAIGIEGTVTGFLGAANNGGTLPAIGDTIADLAIAVGLDSVIPSLAGFTNIKVVGPVEYDFKKGPATFTFSFKSGRLN